MLTDIDKHKLSSKRWRIERLYKIVDKDRKLVPMRMNEEQAKLYNAYADKKKVGTNLREMQLKNRQIGMTTFHALWMLDDCIFKDNQNACIIAHNKDALEKIFGIVKTAWMNMPETLKPEATRENKRELYFPHTNSTIFITLKARSGTLSHLHVSEYAFIDDIQELKSGSFQAAGRGDITIEFTAKGLNHAYADYNDESIVWSKYFFPWQGHAEYSIDTKWTGKCEHESYLDALETTPEQKSWWYFKLDELGELMLMHQEYPSSAEEAFVTNNDGIFKDGLQGIKPLKVLEVREEANCTIETYQKAVEGEQYVVGADSSGGHSSGDYSCFYIINSKTRDITMRWHGRLAPDLFGKEIEKYAKEYNNAFCGIEVNNHGLSVINAIKEDYSELYRRERRDRVTEETTKELGWNTTAKSRDEMIDEIKINLREYDELPSALIRELRTFVKKENGRVEAEDGCHDDEVFGFGIALMMIKANPFWEFKKRERKYMGR